MANVVAGELLLFPENKKVEVFETPADLVYNKFNALFAHLFSKLANSHSMSLFHVSPGKGSTVPKIVNDTFPAIRATNDQPTPMVTSKTVGYIHALVIDTLTFHSTDATFAQAITNSEVICGELDALTPAVFRAEVSACLLDYYEKICGMAGVGGVKSVPRRRFAAKTDASSAAAAETDADGASSQAADGDIEAVSAPPAAGAPAAVLYLVTAPAAGAPAAASPPGKQAAPAAVSPPGKGGKGGKPAGKPKSKSS